MAPAIDGVGDGGAAAAAAAAAAAEAAKRAAEEAARRAAEEAARRAAEEAAKQAAEAAMRAQQAAQQKASQANVDRLDAKKFDMAPPDFDKMTQGAPKAQAPQESAADAAAERLANMGSSPNADSPQADKVLQNSAKQVQPITNDDAKKEMTSISDGMKNAKSPDDLAALEQRSNVLRGRLMASPNADPALSAKADQLHTEAAKANAAVQTIRDTKARMDRDPHEAANVTAQLMAGNPNLQQAIGDLKGLKGSPLLEGVGKDVTAIAQNATPEKLTGQLMADPDMSHYPPGTAANLAKLEGSGDPTIQDGLDAVGKNALAQPGGISVDQAKSNPDLVKLAAGAAQNDPAAMQQLQGQMKQWAQSSLDAAMKDKNHNSWKKGLDQFKGDMKDLADKTGLGPLIGKAASDVVNEKSNQDMIKHAADKDKGFFDHLGDFVGSIGDFASGLAKDLGHVVGEGLNLVGDGLQEGLHYAGKAVSTVTHLEGQALGTALKGVGLDGAGNFVEHAADKVADVQQQFADGAGDGFKGMASSMGFMIEHPGATVKAFGQMIQHPELIAKAGKAMWEEASKGGYAHAAGYIAANLLPMVLSGGGAGVAEAGGEAVAEVATEGAARGAAEVAVEGAARETAEAATETAARGGAEAAAEEASGGLLKTAGKYAAEQVKNQFVDLREVAGNTQKLVGDLKEVPKNLVNDLKEAGAALRSGHIHKVLEAFHDNSLVSVAKDATGILKDTKDFVGDTVGLVTDPAKVFTDKLEGLFTDQQKMLLKPLDGNANTRLVRNQVVANVNEKALPV